MICELRHKHAKLSELRCEVNCVTKQHQTIVVVTLLFVLVCKVHIYWCTGNTRVIGTVR